MINMGKNVPLTIELAEGAVQIVPSVKSGLVRIISASGVSVRVGTEAGTKSLLVIVEQGDEINVSKLAGPLQIISIVKGKG